MYKALNGLVSKLSDKMHVHCSRPAAGHFTESARKVTFLKRGFRQLISALAIKIKRNFCDYVSINKSSMLTLLGKCGQCG